MKKFVLKASRRIHRYLFGFNWRDESRVQFKDQEANDYIRSRIETSTDGLMISRFGTVELENITCYRQLSNGYKLSDYRDFICDKGEVFPEDSLKRLCHNAGFFPQSLELWKQYAELVISDLPYIDILGSYINNETYFDDELSNSVKVMLGVICCPYDYETPWSSALKNKRVLVVHPFTDSIKKQYEKRELLFPSPDVLPEFKDLILIKAVQSIAGNGATTGYRDWFEALHAMEQEIDSYEYDIAVIGCGAYGMNLAAHVKRRGKIAIHMAGATQMLFGIYGERYANSPVINSHWIRPNDNETPARAKQVEGGCYW